MKEGKKEERNEGRREVKIEKLKYEEIINDRYQLKTIQCTIINK